MIFSDADSDIKVNGLKDDLIRFRLQGPLSHPVLLDALQVAEVISMATESEEVDMTWWEKFYAVSMLLIQGWQTCQLSHFLLVEGSWSSPSIKSPPPPLQLGISF